MEPTLVSIQTLVDLVLSEYPLLKYVLSRNAHNDPVN